MFDEEDFLEYKIPAMGTHGHRIDELIKDVRNIATIIYENKILDTAAYETLGKVLIERCDEINERKENIFSILYDVKNELQEEEEDDEGDDEE